MKFVSAAIALSFTLLLGCQISTKIPADNFIWLEEIEGEKQLSWVREKNKQTMNLVTKDTRFEPLKKELLEIYTADDRIALPRFNGRFINNFWRDKKNVRGVWRRTTRKSYKKKSPNWEVVLDVDKLSEKEGENWVYKGSKCLAPTYRLCLVRLSKGGTDASVIREFDTQAKAFVTQGFELPQAKSNYSWYDKDHLLVGTDFGEGSLTDSGYPAMVKLWKRGTPLSQAKLVYQGTSKDVSVSSSVFLTPEGKTSFVTNYTSFFSSKKYLLSQNMQLKELPVPEDSEISSVIGDQLVLSLRSKWNDFKAGSVISVSLSEFNNSGQFTNYSLVYEPNSKATVNYVTRSKSGLFLNLSENVMGKVIYSEFRDGKWSQQTLQFPEGGVINNISTNAQTDVTYFSYESFTQPRTLYELATPLSPPVKRKSQPARFDGKQFETKQFFATSRDGTQVPYFIVHKKGLKLDGSHPTLQYGYGGFEISMKPYHSSTIGKTWLAKGGVYVLANIRGGGEFGPKWHQAALKTSRQLAYDDFIAASEDLIARKITNPEKLAIKGGSNGGLLVGAVLVQRPELYKGIICQVPLLDMVRFHKLLAGASWVGEYGSVENEKERNAILKYSPYQNVFADKSYPEARFITSTKDDRVHPGHARKMVAKMSDQGHKVHYYETIEGGHSAAANQIQRAHRTAIEMVYLYNQLKF